MHKITVISKHGCHICERAIETLASLNAQSKFFELEIVYIEDDENLHDLYFLKVPVIRLDGRDVFEAEDIALPVDCEEKLSKLALGTHSDP